MDPQWVIAVASSVAALGVLGIAIQSAAAISQLKISSGQLKTSIDQLQADHERSRRERAVELLSQWDAGLTRNAALARKLAETFDFDQSKSLFEQESFQIDCTHYELFLGAIPLSSENRRREDKQEDNKIQVSERESSEIRWAVISYLNRLEATLTAVRHNVADKDMIYEQFEYLVAPSDGHYVLEDFRRAAGGTATYPSIEEFANELKTKHSQVNPGKARIA